MRTDHPAFCRVSLLTPRTRVDVALPADVPLAELVPLVLELIGEPRRPHAPVAWRFSGATGGPLPAGVTLAALRVPDGELLRLAPHAPPPVAPVFDDPMDAVAASAGGGRGTGGPRLRAGVALSAALLAAGLVTWAPGPAVGTVATVLAVLVAATGAGICLGRAAAAARIAIGGASPASGPGAGFAAAVAALCAVPLAAAAGWAAVPGPPGAGQLLVAAAAAGCAAAAGQILVRVIAPVLVAAVVAAIALVGIALLRLWLGASPTALAAGAATLALAVGPLLPRLALRLAGLPEPSVPTDADELVHDDRLDRLPPAELADRTDLARGFLAGLVTGTATVVGVAAVPVATAGGWAGPVLAGTLLVATGLRSRGFADTAPARATLVAALAGAAGVCVLLAASGGSVVRLAVAGVVGAVALAAVSLVGRTEPVASPVSRRAVDLLEGLLVAAAVPLALHVMGIYALVRGW
ncbi:MAG: type VII secretion integral membrane protein EccD [Pseudonocardia sp.]